MLCILVRFSPLFPIPSRFSLPTQLHIFFSLKQTNKQKPKVKIKANKRNLPTFKKLPKQNKSKKKKHGVNFVF